MCDKQTYIEYITNSHTVHNVCYKNTIDENPSCFHILNGIKVIETFLSFFLNMQNNKANEIFSHFGDFYAIMKT